MTYLRYFFFNDPATTEIYTLSLHDALPISGFLTMKGGCHNLGPAAAAAGVPGYFLIGALDEAYRRENITADRKSTRLNSSHANISYAVFCLKKKKNTTTRQTVTRPR